MKKLFQYTIALTMAIALFATNATVFAANEDRFKDNDARAFQIQTGKYEFQNLPLSSFFDKLVVYLKPGESWTIDKPNIEGFVAQNLIINGDKVVDFPFTVRYEDIPANDSVFDNSASKVPITMDIQVKGETPDGNLYKQMPAFEVNAPADPKTIHDTAVREINVNGIPVSNAVISESWREFYIYAKDGAPLPVKSSTKNYLGGIYVSGQKLSDVKQTLNMVSEIYENTLYGGVVFAFDGEPVRGVDRSQPGYWEAWDLSTIPGNEDYYYNAEADKPEPDETTTGSDDDSSSDTDSDTNGSEDATNDNKSSDSSNPAVWYGTVGVIAVIIVLAIRAKAKK